MSCKLCAHLMYMFLIIEGIVCACVCIYVCVCVCGCRGMTSILFVPSFVQVTSMWLPGMRNTPS